MEKPNISSEIKSFVMNYIIRRRAELRNEAIEDAIRAFDCGMCYSCVSDFVHRTTSTSIGQIIGAYNLAWNLGVICDNDIEELCSTVCKMFDDDIIIESAINKMKGRKENGYKA